MSLKPHLHAPDQQSTKIVFKEVILIPHFIKEF